MGCDYYIYTVLKIIHNTGVSCIKLSEEPVYLHGYDDDKPDFTIHPSKRRPKIDHMQPDCEDILIYKKGELTKYHFMNEYRELIDEYIKENLDMDYVSKNKIIIHNSFFSKNHPDSGEMLKNIVDINEMYIIEFRQWRQ